MIPLNHHNIYRKLSVVNRWVVPPTKPIHACMALWWLTIIWWLSEPSHGFMVLPLTPLHSRVSTSWPTTLTRLDIVPAIARGWAFVVERVRVWGIEGESLRQRGKSLWNPMLKKGMCMIFRAKASIWSWQGETTKKTIPEMVLLGHHSDMTRLQGVRGWDVKRMNGERARRQGVKEWKVKRWSLRSQVL